jgi:effector-binding domain-containing protein
MMVGVKLESRKPMTIAYIEHVGSYSGIPFGKYMERLYGWAKEKKVMPGFHPLGLFHSDPKTTPPEECRTEIAIPIYGNVKASGDIKIKKLPAMKVATYSHKGPASEYSNSYDKLHSWIRERGYKVSGPAMEVYSKKPEMVKGEMILYAKILIPVKKI